MSNILYIGPYREFTGMGNAARQYIKALLVAGHNIGIRPIYNIFKAYPEKDIDYEILELESNISKPYDILIQHCYPHQLYYDNRFQKNIGIIHLESNNYYSNLSNYINMMDEIIVGSNFVHKTLSSINFDKPIKVVPEPIDLEFIKKYRDNNARSIKNNYSFYAIGDLSERKNLYEIVKAFVVAYDTDDNVDLVLKIISNQERVATDQEIEYELNKIYSRIKKNYEKRPRIVFGDIDYHSMLYLHNNNDCFINVSSGESFGYSTLEAMAFNNQLIVNDHIGSSEIIDEDCGLFNNVYKRSCEDSSRLYHIYNSYHQSWHKPEIDSLIVNMNTARNESKENREKRVEKQNDRLNNFSIESISKTLINI
jgi:glycosyltransferase involved in cell wall biosynthesis